MPELPFVQFMAVAAVAAMAVVVLAMPVGAKVGARAGHALLRASLVGSAAAFAAALIWGGQSGDLARFNAAVGVSVWLQLGLFFIIVYGTGYRFVAAYLADMHQQLAKEAADA